MSFVVDDIVNPTWPLRNTCFNLGPKTDELGNDS